MDNSVLLVVSRSSSYCSSILPSTSRTKDQSDYSKKCGHYWIQCRLRVTSMHAGNRCWQIVTSRPRWTLNQPTRWTRKIQRKAFLFGYSPWQWILKTWRDVLAHSSERANSDSEGDASKVETPKRKHSVHAYFRKKLKEICSAIRKVWWLDNKRARSSAKYVNLGTITDTLSWHKFSPLNGIRVRPKLHRRRRRIYESSNSRCRSQKVVHTYHLLEFGKCCEELSWSHRKN